MISDYFCTKRAHCVPILYEGEEYMEGMHNCTSCKLYQKGSYFCEDAFKKPFCKDFMLKKELRRIPENDSYWMHPGNTR